jgi:hypothetical protein
MKGKLVIDEGRSSTFWWHIELDEGVTVDGSIEFEITRKAARKKGQVWAKKLGIEVTE